MTVVKVQTFHLFHETQPRRYVFKIINDEATVERYVAGQLEYRLRKTLDDARWLWRRLTQGGYYSR